MFSWRAKLIIGLTAGLLFFLELMLALVFLPKA